MRTRRTIAMGLAVGMLLALAGAARAGTVAGQFDWYDIIEADGTSNSWTQQVTVVDPDSGESATIDFTLTNTAGRAFKRFDGDRGAVDGGTGGWPAVDADEDLAFTASLVSQTGALGVGVNVTDLGIRGRGTSVPVTLSWSSTATAGPVAYVNPPTETDYAMDGAADFANINWSNYVGTLDNTSNISGASPGVYQFSDRGTAGVSYSVNFGVLPPPSPLSLVNGGFDDDGPTGGFVTAISDWTRTAGNGGWYDAPAGVTPSTSPNMGLLNAGTSSFTGTELVSDPLPGSILPGTEYTLAFDVAVREQGQFGGPANTLANLGTYDVDVALVGSVDGVLASMDAVELITSVDTWFPGELVWDSTGATATQDVTVVLSATNTGSTHLQFAMDSLTLTARQEVIPEPATMTALGLAVAGLGGYFRRRRR